MGMQETAKLPYNASVNCVRLQTYAVGVQNNCVGFIHVYSHHSLHHMSTMAEIERLILTGEGLIKQYYM